MKVIDISIPLDEKMPVWPGEKGFSRIEKHVDHICVTEISMGLHSGTHVDAPYHFLRHGKRLNELPLTRFFGPVKVVEVTNSLSIGLTEIAAVDLKNTRRILFKTANSSLLLNSTFTENFIGLDLDAAKYLIDLGVELVGTDYLSIEEYNSPGNPVHTLLLEAEIVILEGLNLLQVCEGDYLLCCVPLKITGAEASPVRAILIEGLSRDLLQVIELE